MKPRYFVFRRELSSSDWRVYGINLCGDCGDCYGTYTTKIAARRACARLNAVA